MLRIRRSHRLLYCHTVDSSLESQLSLCSLSYYTHVVVYCTILIMFYTLFYSSCSILYSKYIMFYTVVYSSIMFYTVLVTHVLYSSQEYILVILIMSCPENRSHGYIACSNLPIK